MPTRFVRRRIVYFVNLQFALCTVTDPLLAYQCLGKRPQAATQGGINGWQRHKRDSWRPARRAPCTANRAATSSTQSNRLCKHVLPHSKCPESRIFNTDKQLHLPWYLD